MAAVGIVEQDKRFVASVAARTEVDEGSAARALQLINQELNRWTVTLMNKVYRPPMTWGDFKATYESEVRWMIFDQMMKYLPRIAAERAEMPEAELRKRANTLAATMMSRNLLQQFYSQVSCCGNWSTSLAQDGHVTYWNSGTSVTAYEEHQHGVHGLDPALQLEMWEEQQLSAVELSQRLEELRSQLTPSQYRALRMVLVDKLPIETVAEVFGEGTTPRAIERRLDRVLQFILGKTKGAGCSTARAALIKAKFDDLQDAQAGAQRADEEKVG